MNDIKATIAKNITEMRLAKGMTQLELAEQLHYSDKAVSKWERGESVPEISTLKAIADLFGVTLDYLVRDEHAQKTDEPMPERKRRFANRTIVTAMSAVLVWIVALLLFAVLDAVLEDTFVHGLVFVYAVPATFLLWLVFNSIWFNPRINFIIISALMWSVLVSLHVTLLACGISMPLLYVLGIPGQAVIALWSRLRPNGKKRDKTQK